MFHIANKLFANEICTLSDYLKKGFKLWQFKISWSDCSHLVLDSVAHSCVLCKMKFGDTGASLISAFYIAI